LKLIAKTVETICYKEMEDFSMNRNDRTLSLVRWMVGFLALVGVLISGWCVQAQPLTNSFLPGSWTKLPGNPVLSAGTPGNWDDNFVFAPSVLLDGSTYKMWYAGSSSASTARKIGYATSPDGLTWNRPVASPVLMPAVAGSWDAKQVGFPSVIKDGSTYKMWYSALDASDIARVGYATSPDGIIWTRYAGNPVLTPGAGGSWDTAYVGSANVIKVGSTYHMWYRGGVNGGIGYATSLDGIAWAKFLGNPVIAIGSGGWDQTAYHPRVVYDEAGFHMWYSGCNLAGDVCQVGYATSPDGSHWTRKGMVLPQGPSGAWDGQGADHVAVLQVGSTLKMWYSGYNGTNYQIGYASAAVLNHQVFIPSARK
jgi:predicted GH43/DUF377 family glycosyl hydrolase